MKTLLGGHREEPVLKEAAGFFSKTEEVTQSNVSVASSNDVVPTNNLVSNDRVKTTNRRASSGGTGEKGVLARNDYNDYDYAKKNGKDSKGGKKKKKKGFIKIIASILLNLA